MLKQIERFLQEDVRRRMVENSVHGGLETARLLEQIEQFAQRDADDDSSTRFNGWGDEVERFSLARQAGNGRVDRYDRTAYSILTRTRVA